MTDTGPPTSEVPPADRCTLVEAVEITGLSVSSIHRRVDAWLSGEEAPRASGYALKGGRAGRNRTVDRRDAWRLRRQLDGEMPSGVESLRSGSESAPAAAPAEASNGNGGDAA